jgi:hypothetical protein
VLLHAMRMYASGRRPTREATLPDAMEPRCGGKVHWASLLAVYASKARENS